MKFFALMLLWLRQASILDYAMLKISPYIISNIILIKRINQVEKNIFISRIYRSNPPDVFSGEDVLRNMQQIYRTASMLKCDFNKVVKQLFDLQLYWNTLRHGCSPVNLQHIFRTLFTKKTYGGLLLDLTSITGIRKW